MMGGARRRGPSARRKTIVVATASVKRARVVDRLELRPNVRRGSTSGLMCRSKSATTNMRHSEAKHPGGRREFGVEAALRPLGRTHHALDQHGRDARKYSLGHWGCQDVGDRT